MKPTRCVGSGTRAALPHVPTDSFRKRARPATVGGICARLARAGRLSLFPAGRPHWLISNICASQDIYGSHVLQLDAFLAHSMGYATGPGPTCCLNHNACVPGTGSQSLMKAKAVPMGFKDTLLSPDPLSPRGDIHGDQHYKSPPHM